MTEEEKLERMRSIPGFVDLPEGWDSALRINSPLILAKGRAHGEIKRDRFVVSNVMTDDEIRAIVRSEVEKILQAKAHKSPPCPKCRSDDTNWFGKGQRAGSRRIYCRSCERTSTI